MSVDHGNALPLPVGARAVFVTARALADENGIVADRSTIAAVVGLTQRQVRTWFAHLEARRFDDRALAKRMKASPELWVQMGDIPGIPPRKSTSVVDEVTPPPPLVQRWRRDRGAHRKDADTRYPGGVADPEFRWLRAVNGGLRRTIAAFKSERDEARALLRKLDARTPHPATEAMAADLKHAADCLNHDCATCLRITEQLEDPDGPYIAITTMEGA